MDWTLGIAVFIAWASLGGLWLQTARGGGVLPETFVSDETRAAGRDSLRRGAWIAAGITALVAAQALVRPHLHPTLAREIARATMFAACPLVVFWGGAPLRRIGRRTAATSPAASSRPPRSARTASLVPRDEEEILPRRWWAAPAVLFLTPVVALAAESAAGVAVSSRTTAVVAVASAASLSFLVTFGAWARLSAGTTQDLSGAEDPEALDRACRAFRRFLARGVFALMTGTVAVCAAAGVAALATDGDAAAQNTWCGLLGGVGGSLVGVGGGVLGAFADRHRRAILELGGTPPEPGAGRPATSGRTPAVR